MASNMIGNALDAGMVNSKSSTSGYTPSVMAPTPVLQPQQSQSVQPKKTSMHLFSDEETAMQKMLDAGKTQSESEAMIQQRRRDLAKEEGVDLNLNDTQKQALLKMVEANVDTKSALQMLKAQKQGEYDALPTYKKIGQAAVGASIGALTTAGKVTNNLLDFVVEPTTGYKGFGEEANKYAEAQKTAENSPGMGTASKVGSNIMGAGMFAAAPSPSIGGPGLGGAVLRGATYGGVYGGLDPITQKGSDATSGEIVKGAVLGGATGAVAGPLIEKVAAPIIAGTVNKGVKYANAGVQAAKNQGISEVLPAIGKSVSRDVTAIPQNIRAGLGDTAASLSTRFNRMDPNKIVEFKAKTGETPGEFLTSRGINTAGEDTVPVLAKNFSESMKQADDGFAAIEGNFKYDAPGKDFLKISLEDLQTKLAREESPQLGKVEKLIEKYDKEGLTQTEINEAKRIYQRENKFSYEGGFSSEAKRSTNILDKIRSWQFSKAADNGFANVAEINKNTQAYKFFLDNLSKKLGKSEGNNAVNLTDWIIMGGDPTNLPAVVVKRLLSTDSAKGLGLRILSGQANKKPQIIKPSAEGIIKSNLNKNVIRTGGGGSNGTTTPGLKALPPPSGKTQGSFTPIKGKMSDTEIIERSKKELPKPGKTTPSVQAKNPIKGSIFDLSDKTGAIRNPFGNADRTGVPRVGTGKTVGESITMKNKSGNTVELNSINKDGIKLAEKSGYTITDTNATNPFIESKIQAPLYHGGREGYTEMRLPAPGESDSLAFGRGVYLTPDKEGIASGYAREGGKLYTTYADIRKPLKPGMKDWQSFIGQGNGDKMHEFLIKKGYDAVIDTKGKYKQIMVVDPKQVKIVK